MKKTFDCSKIINKNKTNKKVFKPGKRNDSNFPHCQTIVNKIKINFNKIFILIKIILNSINIYIYIYKFFYRLKKGILLKRETIRTKNHA